MTANQPDPDELLQQAVRLVLAALPQDRQATPEEIDSTVELICGMKYARGEAVDREGLRREIQSRVAVWQEDPIGLEDSRDHVEWLTAALSERTWDFWDRYRQYLEDVRILPPRVVRLLDQSTSRILRKIEDPQRGGHWRRTGLVVGQVQSGKTGNYIGLACKAADAGYKLIIVLAGVHNSLRSQTQLRIDEGLLGFDTQYQQRSDESTGSARIGVGSIPGARRLKIASLTTSAENGDFKRNIARNMNLPIGDFPVVLVVKKHRSILEYVRRWIVEVEGERVPGGKDKIVHDVPVLVIDDEADHASVDTSKDDETDPTAINKAIRKLLNSFDRAIYIGYTATPFANIYISSSTDHDEFGADLFPDSFIESLPAPSNYLGPERVFGLRADDPDDESIEALPIFCRVNDHDTWMPRGHRKDWQLPAEVPASLGTAVDTFVLTCAARRARGQSRGHNSMLVHVTRFQNVQHAVRDQIDDYVDLMHNRLRDSYGDQASHVLTRLERLWEQDFTRITRSFPAEEAKRIRWEQVAAEIRPVLAALQVRAVNGTSRDALEYYEHRRQGLTVIAVGGDKLSRGLTLEGLSVSYYLRASTAYDTLLQMGRWFGYRPGYEDLCRLFTTQDLYSAYREITAADNELRRDFEYMATLDATPADFGLRIRSSSAGLAVTAPNKMRRGVKVRLSYSGSIPETTTFSLREEAVRRNFENLERFVARLDETTTGETVPGRGIILWRGVPPSEVIDGFFEDYVADRRMQRVRPAFIAEYIRRCVQVNELIRWNVLLAGNAQGEPESIGGHKTGLIVRNPHPPLADDDRFTIRRVLNPADESVDLSDRQRSAALEGTRAERRRSAARKNREYKETDVPTGPPLRAQRGPDQPLLMIYPITHPAPGRSADPRPVVGFAVSFPVSGHATETEYIVNEVWRQQEIEDPDDGDVSQ